MPKRIYLSRIKFEELSESENVQDFSTVGRNGARVGGPLPKAKNQKANAAPGISARIYRTGPLSPSSRRSRSWASHRLIRLFPDEAEFPLVPPPFIRRFETARNLFASRFMKWETLLNPHRPRKSTVIADFREEFERDFDRSIFSTPVKRLQDKAQVFPLDPCDAVRTRLTHSLEVSSVARGLAAKLGKWLLEKGEIKPGMERQLEAVSGTSALIHDLGNPPFGHAGEDAIRDWFEKHASSSHPELSPTEFFKREFDGADQRSQDLLKFEGNAQTLRLVTKLQLLADFNGLNLTFATLSAACKYTAASHQADRSHPNKAMRKPGYFASENDIVRRVRDETGTGDSRNPITYLVEAADDIVYSVADIEDGIKKGVISWREIEERLKKQGSEVTEKLASVLGIKDGILKAGRPEIPNYLPDDTHGSAFRTASISVCVKDAFSAFTTHYQEIKDGTYQGDLMTGCESSQFIEALKQIGVDRIYCTPSTLKLELMGRQIIGDLMTLFWEGAEALPLDRDPKTNSFPGRIGALLSRNYREVFKDARKTDPSAPERYHRYQLVTDYVCGMTDSFACRIHHELFDAA